MKIGLALSGGGARGVAHIGVLYALNEMGVFPNRISGTSAGALIGALYCKGLSPLEMLELTKTQSFSKIFHIGITSKGLSTHRYLDEVLMQSIGQTHFNELEIPLSVGVTNIDSGRFQIIDSGKVKTAVSASCAIPLLFKPVQINGVSYVDGGILNNLPVEPLLDVCDKVIGIGVHQHRYAHRIDGMRDVGVRCFQLAIWNTMEERFKKCDIALDVSAAAEIGMFDLDRADELFDIGKAAVVARKKDFVHLLDGKKTPSKTII